MADGDARPLVVDVLVVGAGIAGAAAFLEAHAAGATVAGVDQLAAFGGTTITAGGGSLAAATDLQRAAGIEDSVEAALEDLLATGDGEADEAWARFYLEHSARDVYGWQVDLGVQFARVRAQEHSRVPRWHGPVGNGKALMGAVWARIEALGLAPAWQFGTEVEDLLVERDRVAGVVARGPGGERLELLARAVVMATGGFAGNHEEVLEHAPHLRRVARVLVGGGVGAQGAGHHLLERHGATLTGTEHVWCYPSLPDHRDPSGLRGLVIRGMEGGIWVNRQGRRFHDESLPGPGHSMPALLAQDPPTCWAILDRRMLEGIRIADPAYRTASGQPSRGLDELIESSPFAHVAADPRELALRAGIDPDGLAATVDAWNSLLASGTAGDPATGRSLAGLEPFGGPPMFALQLFPLARKNLGGVRTDLRCRVLRADGSTVDGLFAAGELCGFAGGHLSGRRAIEGIMIGASLFSGRVAGAWAAHAAGGPEPAHLDARNRPSEPPAPLRRGDPMH